MLPDKTMKSSDLRSENDVMKIYHKWENVDTVLSG